MISIYKNKKILYNMIFLGYMSICKLLFNYIGNRLQGAVYYRDKMGNTRQMNSQVNKQVNKQIIIK